MEMPVGPKITGISSPILLRTNFVQRFDPFEYTFVSNFFGNVTSNTHPPRARPLSGRSRKSIQSSQRNSSAQKATETSFRNSETLNGGRRCCKEFGEPWRGPGRIRRESNDFSV